MIVDTPYFINSPFLIIDERGWRLKENAPAKLKKDFDEFMKLIQEK